jgi:hypothetical protein
MFGRHQSEISHQLARIGEAREVAQFGDQGRRIDQRHAAHRLQRCDHRRQGPVRQQRRDLRGQPIAPRRGRVDRLDVILEHEMVGRLLKAQTGEPPAMQLGPGGTPVMPALTQQKPRELLAGTTQRMHRIQALSHQITHRLVSGVRDPHRRQLARPMQPRQARRIAPIGLDPVAGPLRDQRRGNDDALMCGRRQLPLDAIAARTRLVAKPKPYPVLAELAQQAIQRRRRVGNPAVFANLAAKAARGDRDNNASSKAVAR